MQRASIYRLIIGFTIAFALLIGIGVLGYQQNAALVRDANAVSRTHQVIARLANLMGAEDVADSDVQLAAVTHAPDTIAAAHAAIVRIAPALADLHTLTADNPNQQQRLDRLEPLLRAHVADLEAALSGADPTVVQPSIEIEIDSLIRAMEQEERQLLDVRTAQSLISVQRTQQIIIGGSVLGLLIGLGTAAVTILALRARDRALSGLAILNSQLDARVQQQTADLHIANEQLAALSHQLIATQEVERGTVAAALHEAIGQEIAALQISLQILDDTSSDPAVRAQLNDSMVAIDRVLDQIRALSFDLRPAALDDFGLVEAIRASIEGQLAANAGIDFTIDAAPLSARLPAAVEAACFRIAQDAIAMVIRAPGVRGLHIQLAEHAGAIELAICGDGADIARVAPAPGSNGSALELLEIRERAAAAGGTIAIDTTTQRGTCIVARFPMDA
ncbi:MAG: CHASE3 domain-containing protein, partial [Roseiflexaceae bacterium]